MSNFAKCFNNNPSLFLTTLVLNAKLTISIFGLLLSACSYEHPELVQAVLDKNHTQMRTLLIKGADPDEHTRKTGGGHSAYSDYHTPLSLAAANGDQTAVQILLQHKANRHKTTRNGSVPLMWALYHEHINVAKLLWEFEPHSGYVDHGTAAMLHLLLKGDIENYQYFRKQLPGNEYTQRIFLGLMRGASSHHHKYHKERVDVALSYLLKEGDKPGVEVFYYSLYWYSPKMINLFLSTGLNPNAIMDKSIIESVNTKKDNNQGRFIKRIHGNTPLMVFLSAPSAFEISSFLLENGADINALNSKGQNGLMHFITSEYTSNAYMSNFTVKMVDGETAPSDHYLKYHLPVIKFYLKHGARTDIIDNSGRGLLELIDPDDFDAQHKIRFIQGWINKYADV